MPKKITPSLNDIVSLAKRRGFVYPASSIYGGLANAYDYGPLGAQLLKNIKDVWWKEFIENRDDMVGLDTQIIQHPQTWVASGHVESFNDPLVEDQVNHKRYRADHLIEDWLKQQTNPPTVDVDSLSLKELAEFISTHKIKSPDGNELSEPKPFSLLFKTHLGVVEGQQDEVYLRGETAQGIFLNFKNVLDSTRVRLPFGIGNIGKSFRNEITTGQFVFRTFEFEQAEIEYFFNPKETNWQKLFKSWQDQMWQFVTKTLGVNESNLRWRRHSDEERSFYSKETYDLDYRFPFGFKELWGIAYRTDYDLKQQAKHSGVDLRYRDPYTQEVFYPHAIEPALGINRAFLMVLVDAYKKDESGRVYLDIKPELAPYHLAVFPLLKNKPELVKKAREIFDQLKTKFRVTWDDRGNIGKRYLYQDEIGTPFAVTVDFDTLEKDEVTVRNRNTTKQEKVPISQLKNYLDAQVKSR